LAWEYFVYFEQNSFRTMRFGITNETQMMLNGFHFLAM